MIELLLEYGANPALPNTVDNRAAAAMAAHRGRSAVPALFEQRGAANNAAFARFGAGPPRCRCVPLRC
jgi:hypothetical protein